MVTKSNRIIYYSFSIRTIPSLAFENLNSLETLNLQNNKLKHIPEEVMEPILDTLRNVDIMGKLNAYILNRTLKSLVI